METFGSTSTNDFGVAQRGTGYSTKDTAKGGTCARDEQPFDAWYNERRDGASLCWERGTAVLGHAGSEPRPVVSKSGTAGGPAVGSTRNVFGGEIGGQQCDRGKSPSTTSASSTDSASGNFCVELELCRRLRCNYTAPAGTNHAGCSSCDTTAASAAQSASSYAGYGQAGSCEENAKGTEGKSKGAKGKSQGSGYHDRGLSTPKGAEASFLKFDFRSCGRLREKNEPTHEGSCGMLCCSVVSCVGRVGCPRELTARVFKFPKSRPQRARYNQKEQSCSRTCPAECVLQCKARVEARVCELYPQKGSSVGSPKGFKGSTEGSKEGFYTGIPYGPQEEGIGSPNSLRVRVQFACSSSPARVPQEGF